MSAQHQVEYSEGLCFKGKYIWFGVNLQFQRPFNLPFLYLGNSNFVKQLSNFFLSLCGTIFAGVVYFFVFLFFLFWVRVLNSKSLASPDSEQQPFYPHFLWLLAFCSLKLGIFQHEGDHLVSGLIKT